MREAHLDVFEANSDIINGVQWVSTLDNRTTPLCRALDGKEWSIPGYEPKGHDMPFPGTTPHWNCRSVVIPVTKTWEELAKEAGGDSDFAKKLDGIPNKERASMGGPVAAGTTYESWFAEQDRERQLEILGPGRMGMYERGTLGFSDMVNMAGKPMTLGELQEKQEKVADKPEYELFFEKAVKEVLEKIECSAPIKLGDLYELDKAEMDKRPLVKYIRHRRSWYEDAGGLCSRYRDTPDGENESVLISVSEQHVKAWFEKGVGKWQGTDGYYYFENLTAEQQVKLVLCHEIAHVICPKRGENREHRELTWKLMTRLFPDFLNIPRLSKTAVRKIRYDLL
jgi:hypothetical protein